MDSKYIKEKNIIARYLRGSLTPEESIEFEEYLIDKPELIEQLEIDSQLMKTLPAVDYKSKRPQTASMQKLWFWTTPLRASFATGFSCLLGFYLFLFYWPDMPVKPPQPGLVAKPSQVVFLDTLRSGSGDTPRQIALIKGSRSISLGIPAEPDYPTIKYKIQVSHSQIAQGKFSTECRLADQSGYFFLTLEGEPLQPGLYVINAIPCHDNLATKHFTLEFIHQPPI